MLKVIKKVILSLIVFMMMISMCIEIQASSARDAADSVVVVGAVSADGESASTGTGFAIGEAGKEIQYIVTNYHVIAAAYETQGMVSVCFSVATSDIVTGEIFATNAKKDIAIIKLPEPTKKRKALVLCPQNKINLDDDFTALGFPAASSLNDYTKLDQSDVVITKGSIAKVSRINEVDCYLLDIKFSEGNSGGPLVNSKGEVVGINAFYIQTQAGEDRAVIQNNYSIVIDELLPMIDRDKIPLTITGELTTLTMIYVGCGALAIILVAVFVILLSKKKKRHKVMIEKETQVISNASNPSSDSAQNKTVPLSSHATITLRGTSGNFANQTFTLIDKIIIGRDSNKCGIAYPLDSPGISGIHCEIYTERNTVYLKDLGSSYGTFLVGSNKITANTPVKLTNGSMFYLASEDNTFEVRM